MFPAGEFGHRHLIAGGFELQAAQHVGELAAEFARVQRSPPQLGERGARQRRGLAGAQGGGDFGLAARHEDDVSGASGQREADRVVGRRVAGVQRGDDVHLGRQQRRGDRLLDAQRVEVHACEAQARGQGARLVDEFATRLDADDAPARTRLEEAVVEDEAQVGLAGAVIDQHRIVAGGKAFAEQRLDEAGQVLHLLQLAPAVLVELAVAREDVQFLEQFDRLPLRELERRIPAPRFSGTAGVARQGGLR